MSQLIDFYRGEGTDAEGRRLDDILRWRNNMLEAVHDFIQWLFPLPEPSQFNPDAPLLTAEDIAAFKYDRVMRANLYRSLERMLRFLGLQLREDGEVVEGDFVRIEQVFGYQNHNWLRITRILRSLRLLGLEAEAQALYRRLVDLQKRRHFPIGDDTFRYWTDAVRD
jgi:hypothetical protein